MKRIFHFILAVTAALFMVCGLVTPVSVKAEDDSFHAIATSLSVDASQDTAEAAKYYLTSIKAEFHEGDKVLKTVTLSAANNWTAAQSTTGIIRISSLVQGHYEIKNGTQHMYPGVANYRRLVKRVYNPNSGDHFYTTHADEKDNLVSLGWRYEDIGW